MIDGSFVKLEIYEYKNPPTSVKYTKLAMLYEYINANFLKDLAFYACHEKHHYVS